MARTKQGTESPNFIKRRNTGTNTIEVHVLSGRSNYQQFVQHTGSALAQAEDANGSFDLGDFDRDGTPDLYFIKRRNTGTNTIEVHILTRLRLRPTRCIAAVCEGGA